MNILLIDNGSYYLPELKKLLEDNPVVIDKWNSDLSKSQSYDLIILSGGHSFSVKNHPRHYKKEIDFIKSNKSPLLGICLGAELIAYSFGARLEKLEKKEKGLAKLEILNNNFLFKGIERLEVYESHKWAIKSLSNDLLGLARSNNGYEIIKHSNQKAYGFQFHPELFKDKTCGKKIFDNLLRNIAQLR